MLSFAMFVTWQSKHGHESTYPQRQLRNRSKSSHLKQTQPMTTAGEGEAMLRLRDSGGTGKLQTAQSIIAVRAELIERRGHIQISMSVCLMDIVWGDSMKNLEIRRRLDWVLLCDNRHCGFLKRLLDLLCLCFQIGTLFV
jgi:hypothetical protein